VNRVYWFTAHVIIRVLHWIAAFPWAYNLIQRLAGREEGHRRMRPYLAQTAGCTVLEVGAGTGDWAAVLPSTARYFWFDNDPKKLRGFRARGTTALAVLGDAARMCLKDKSVGWALCFAMSHHLKDDELRMFLCSLAKVSRKGMIFFDGLRSEGFWISELLWKYDRGAYPRRLESLRPFIEEFFDIEKEEQFAVYHNYWVCQAKPKV
jgi:SAM-dependent methyltransferase